MAARAAFLLLLSVAPSAWANTLRGGRDSLDAVMQPEVVARTLKEVETKWQAEAASFVNCNAKHGNCAGTPSTFEKSCGTVIDAIVQGSGGDKRVAMEYMTTICNQQIKGLHKQHCMNLKTALATAMTADSYQNRNSFTSAKLCNSFWSEFVSEEKNRFAKEEEERKVAEKKAAEEAAKRAKEAAEKKAAEEAAAKKAKEEAEKKAAEEAARKKIEEAKRVKAEAQAKAKEAADKLAKKKAEAEEFAKKAKAKLEEAAEAEREHKKAVEVMNSKANSKEEEAAKKTVAKVAAEAKAAAPTETAAKQEVAKKKQEEPAKTTAPKPAPQMLNAAINAKPSPPVTKPAPPAEKKVEAAVPKVQTAAAAAVPEKKAAQISGFAKMLR